jgi:hypothetical protein
VAYEPPCGSSNLALRLILVAVAGYAMAPALGQPAAPPADWARHLDRLLDGVREIAAPGVPGPLVVFGEHAFPVVVGSVDEDLRAPVAAAAEMGAGRVVAFGHDGYLSRGTAEHDETARFLLNAVKWTAGFENDDSRAPRVALRGGKLTRLFEDRGIKAEPLEGPNWIDQLADFDVLCCQGSRLSEREIDAIIEFVRAGGGLVTGATGWGWLQLNPGKDLNQHPGNRILAAAGIAWSDGYLKRTSDNGYATNRPPPEMCHAARAVEALATHSANPSKLSDGELAQASWTATHAARNMPEADQLLRPKLASLLAEHNDQLVPTKSEPITAKDSLARFLLALQVEQLRNLAPEDIHAHPAAKAFPGEVPTDAPRISRRIEIDTKVPGWHSTGRYAVPGEPIVIDGPAGAASAELNVRIGAHTDRLWDKPSWSRVPEIARSEALTGPRTTIASAFGGLVYIDVPEKCELGKISLTISGAVEAPHYVLGTTDLKRWREEIRRRPAPWSELESGKIILTVPSEVVRELDDPESLMKFWDQVADACAELAAWPLERPRPERYVADAQISAGYMHSGYPLMTHLDAAEVMTDRQRMMTNAHGGVWGLFHELGHNHQSRDWTFAGTGEVTVNLFTLHVFDKVCSNYEGCRPQLFGESRTKRIREYLDGGADFSQWKRDPFLALLMYMQIREAFGWEAYKNVFAEYRALPDEQRPKNDDEKRDQWLVRLSRTVGRNLGPFFEAWGVPTSEQARASIAELPAWMPPDFPPE